MTAAPDFRLARRSRGADTSIREGLA